MRWQAKPRQSRNVSETTRRINSSRHWHSLECKSSLVCLNLPQITFDLFEAPFFAREITEQILKLDDCYVEACLFNEFFFARVFKAIEKLSGSSSQLGTICECRNKALENNI